MGATSAAMAPRDVRAGDATGAIASPFALR